MSREVPKKELLRLGFYFGLGLCASVMVVAGGADLLVKAWDLLSIGYSWLIQ